MNKNPSVEIIVLAMLLIITLSIILYDDIILLKSKYCYAIPTVIAILFLAGMILHEIFYFFDVKSYAIEIHQEKV